MEYTFAAQMTTFCIPVRISYSVEKEEPETGYLGHGPIVDSVIIEGFEIDVCRATGHTDPVTTKKLLTEAERLAVENFRKMINQEGA